MSLTTYIKNKISFLDLVSENEDLKRQGRLYKALCPFHNENTPSFIVDPEKNIWRCFGACSVGGDIFSFLMKKLYLKQQANHDQEIQLKTRHQEYFFL